MSANEFSVTNAGDLLRKFTKCGPDVLVPIQPTPKTKKYFFEAYLGWAKENMGLSNKRVALAYVVSALCVPDPFRERDTTNGLKLLGNIIRSRRTDPLMRAVLEKMAGVDFLDLEVRDAAARMVNTLPPLVPAPRQKAGLLRKFGF